MRIREKLDISNLLKQILNLFIMKTLKELNSKWYWRLVKVIWVLFLFIILIGSAVWFWDFYKTYNPDDIKKVSEEIVEYYWSYVKLTDSIWDINWDISKEKLKKITFERNWRYEITNWTILYILSHNRKAKIEWVLYLTNKDNWYYYRCPTDVCTHYTEDLPRDLSDYISSWSTLYVTSDDVDNFSSYENSLISLNSELEEFKNGNSSFEDVYLLRNSFFNKNEYFYETHRWFTEWAKIIASTIWIFIGLAVFTIIFRWIFYYIAFWKFNPIE